MRRHGAWRVVLLALVLAAVINGIAAAARDRSTTQAAWQWSVPVPGDTVATADGATTSSTVRVLAQAGTFTLNAAEEDGELFVGPATGAAAQLQPLAAVAGDQALVVYSAAGAAPGAQAVVGVARSDVDRVSALLGDGSSVDLPLNEWRGFSYTASAPTQAATAIDAYASGSSVGEVALPPTTVNGSAAVTKSVAVYGVGRASLTAQTLRISRIDPRTLRPTASGLVIRGAVAGPLALSPDQTKLAFVTSPSYVNANGARLQIIDLKRMAVIHTFPLGKTVIRALSWPTQTSLLELRQTMRPPYRRDVATRTVRAINPLTGKSTGSGTITNKLAVAQAVATPEGMTLLLTQSGLRAHADAQLVVVSADARARSITLPLRAIKNGSLMSRMTIDAATNHAYAVAPGGTVFDVDESAMTFTRHQVARPPQLTQPAAIGFPAVDMLGDQLVVAGLFKNASGAPVQGVVLVDPTDWSSRIVDATASRFVVLGNRLLTYGMTMRTGIPHVPIGQGLTLYDDTGQRITHLYGSRAFENVFMTPGFGHVLYNGKTSGTPPKPGMRYPRGAIYYAGPNDQLAFGLHNGAPAGGGPVSTAKPPLGPGILVFRGSQSVGESGARETAAASPTPAPAATASPTPPATATTMTPFSARTIQAARPAHGYTVSNPGRLVHGQSRPFFDDPHVKPQLYLLGTAGATAFYRVQVTAHFLCWGSGKASAIGRIGMLGCPTVVGAYPLELDDNVASMSAKKPRVPMYLRIDGLVADGAVKVDLRDRNGKTVATAAVTNNVYTFPPPYPKTFLRVVPVDANGHDLLPHPAWGEHQQPPPYLFGPRATKVEPSRIGRVIQRGSGDGVDVSVGATGIVDVRLASVSAQTRQLISGRNVGVNCFSVSPTIRHSRGAGVSVTWGSTNEVAFEIMGYIKPPFDGCEISSTVGHRWHDQWGTHSPVEVPLTKRGAWYFANRATARDLALFVRSRQMHELRKLEGAAFIAAARKEYGNRIAILASATASAPAGTVGVWASGPRTVISERSRANGHFYVELDNGRITKENVRGLAFVF